MEEAHSFTKPHLLQQHYINAQLQANPRDKGKSCSHFFLKFLFVALFLSLLPLFPSEPPGFISNTVSAKTWELIHLLIIGIALSYGLFCRPKTPQIPPKPQMSQPYAPNILHHSSISDYEEENPSGVSDKNAIPTQSLNLSNYRTEPIVISRRENCNETPSLGLPIRSLRSRVVESESEEEEEDVSGSECDSDLNGSNSSNTSEKDESYLEGILGNSSPILGKSQSMRRDFFMAENGKFEGKQSNFESFRSPAAAASCQKFSGFCSWLPESPNMGRENWRENNFHMPFSNFNQINDYNLMGISPNLQNTPNSYMPPAAFHPSMSVPMPFSASDFASSSVKYNHENQHRNNANFGYRSTSVENSGFFMPLGEENTNISLPSAVFSPSMPASTDDLSLSVKGSESTNFNHESSLKKMNKISSKGNNVTEGSFQEVTNSCTPHSDDLLSGGKSPKLENGTLGDGIPNLLKNTAEVLPSVPYPVNQFASSVKSSRSTTFNHKASVKKDKEKSKKEDVGSFGEKNGSNTPHIVDPFSLPGSRVDIPPKKTEQRSLPERWGDDCFVIPSENNQAGDILLENPSQSLANSSEARSSTGSSSRKSSHGQGSPLNKVNEHVPWNAGVNNSEIENVTDDILDENDAYKPSTPSPPSRVQTRINDYVASSVESSSRALGNQSFLKDDDDAHGSPPTPERRKPLSRASHSRRFSCGSFFDRDLRKSFRDEAKGANKKTKGDDDQFARGGMCGWDCLKLDVKPALNRAALKGKSVRTVRPKEITQDRNKNNHIELNCKEYNEGLAVANGEERKGEKSETVVIKIGISDKRSNSNGKKGEKLQKNDGTTSILVGLNSKHNSNDTISVPDDAKEVENDGEIDRKADEFIAKFKEQIRLQKVAPRSVSSRRH